MTLRATDKFKVWLLLLLVVLVLVIIRVAEPPLIWAAPAPGGQGPRADGGSDLLGSAPTVSNIINAKAGIRILSDS